MLWKRSVRVLRYFRFISATRNNRGPNDLGISCAMLMGACKFIRRFREHSADAVTSRRWHLRRGHY